MPISGFWPSFLPPKKTPVAKPRIATDEAMQVFQLVADRTLALYDALEQQDHGPLLYLLRAQSPISRQAVEQDVVHSQEVLSTLLESPPRNGG